MKSIILFRSCDAQTPLASLKRRRKLATWIILTWLLSVVGMIEGMSAMIFFRGRMFEIIVILAAQVISTVTTLPAIFLLPVVGEYERELARRGKLEAGFVPVHRRIPRYVLRMMIVLAVLITVPSWVK